MGKPSPPSGPSDRALITITEKNIESNEKLFADYMEWQNRATDVQRELQGKYQELAEDKFRQQSRLDEERMELTRDAQEAQTRFMEQSTRFAEKQEKRSDKQFDLAFDAAKKKYEFSNFLQDRYREQVLPQQDEYMDRLSGWDHPQRRQDRAAKAAADVATANESKRAQEARRLESYGLDPSQIRSSALDKRVNTRGAVAEAAAATQGRRAVEKEGIAYGGEAVNVGSGLPSSSAQALSVGSSASQGAFANAASAQAAQNQAFQTGQAGYGQLDSMMASRQSGGLQALQTAGNQVSQGFRNQLEGYGLASGMIGQRNDMAVDTFNAQVNKYAVDSENYRTELANSPLNTAAGIAGSVLPLFAEEGGYVPQEVSPSGGAVPDDVPAKLSAGEAVLPEEVVRYHGLKTLNKMTKEAREAMGIPEEEENANG